jgi:hypothetical protein
VAHYAQRDEAAVRRQTTEVAFALFKLRELFDAAQA